MTPQPTDKLDATTYVAVNGPAGETLPDERIVRCHASGPSAACLSRMLGNGHVRLYVGPMVMLKTRWSGGVCPAQRDLAG
jgi:hypothetical protein